MKTNNTYFYVNTTYDPDIKSIKDIFTQAKSDIEDIFNYDYDDYYNYNHNYFYDYPYYYNIFNDESNNDETIEEESNETESNETESEKLGSKLKLKTQKLKNLKKKRQKLDEGGLFSGIGNMIAKPINAITGGASNIINSATSGIAGMLPWNNASNYNINEDKETY